MGKLCSSSWCCACLGHTGSSPPPPHVHPPQHPLSPPSPPPSPPPVCPQQQSIAGPSTTADDLDINSFLNKFKDINQADDLVSLIEKLLKKVSGEDTEPDGPSTSHVDSYIQDGENFLKILEKHIDRLSDKRDFASVTSVHTEKIVVELLKGAGKIHWVGAALSVVGFVVGRFGQISDNQSECLELLRRMLNLGKSIQQLNEQIQDQKQKLEEAVQCIVAGSIMCCSHFKTGFICKFLAASVTAESLNAFGQKIDRLYTHLILTTTIHMDKKVPVVLSPSQNLYSNELPVGIQNRRKEVIELLELSGMYKSPLIVVVYGVGGIGKTTLADDAYANIDLTTYKHCRIHIDQNCRWSDLANLQQQILRDLFGKNINLRDCDEGRGMITSSLKEKSSTSSSEAIFLYIDNALKHTDLRELLPGDFGSCLPKDSRMLVTARDLHETDILVSVGISRKAYPVASLPDMEARKLLCKKALGQEDACFEESINVDALVTACGGIPLVLEIVGSQLLMENRISACEMILESLRGGDDVKEQDASDRIVDFAYQRLEARIQEAFLDIVSFFLHWGDIREVTYIVGEEEFRRLEEASFVKTTEEGGLVVHDIVRARVQKMAELNRITDVESLVEILEDNKKENLQNVKGIRVQLGHGHPPIKFEEHHLNWMSNSLRVFVVIARDGLIINGKCQKQLKNLRCLKLEVNLPYLPVELMKLDQLRVFRGEFTEGISLYEFPRSLLVMDIRRQFAGWNAVAYSKTPPEITPDCELRILRLRGLDNMKRLPDKIHDLTKLEILTLGSSSLIELPSDVGQLCSLKWLQLDSCSSLKQLPASFGKLAELETLELTNCHSLSELPSNFEELSNLKDLVLSGCPSLRELPSNFGQLNKLEKLQLIMCDALTKLPSDFGQLRSLRSLQIHRCSGLEELPLGFGQLSNLNDLNLSDCSSLKELSTDLDHLKKLKYLKLGGCFSLRDLPLNFGHLENMEELNLAFCYSLKKLPSSFGKLKNLKKLVLSYINSLEELPLNFEDLINMEELNLTFCYSLKKLPLNFGKLKNMKKLDLSYNRILEELPLSFEDLINMEELNLANCSNLKKLPLNFGKLKNMKRLDLSYTSRLKELPPNFENLTNMEELNLSCCSSNLKEIWLKFAKPNCKVVS